MKQHLTILMSLIALLSVNADDILVNESGLQGTYTTISDAVQAANPGDRILIAPQVSPYKEDTLFIDKNLTLMPAATNSFVTFDGHIKLTLDNIDNFTLIGFREPSYGLFKSVFSNINDTTTNTYSIINIIDCKINTIRLDQPKTSLYLSYSRVEHVAFAHGDIIGNRIDQKLYFGLFDYSAIDGSYTNCGYNTNEEDEDDWICTIGNIQEYWDKSHANGNKLNASDYMSECELLHGATSIPFGNVNTYSDTCHIIANFVINDIVAFSSEFPFDIRNNDFYQDYNRAISIYLMSPSTKGTNQIINNGGYQNDDQIRFNLAFCDDNNVDSLFNLSDVNMEILNNSFSGNCLEFYAPESLMNANSFSNFPINGQGIFAFNQDDNFICFDGQDSDSDLLQVFESWFEIGPNSGYNPSLKYLNLDLTPNSHGVNGGSHAWINYHGDTDYNSAGNMPEGSKARITHLNLPTQILDPSTNINIKAKSVHGN